MPIVIGTAIHAALLFGPSIGLSGAALAGATYLGAALLISTPAPRSVGVSQYRLRNGANND